MRYPVAGLDRLSDTNYPQSWLHRREIRFCHVPGRAVPKRATMPDSNSPAGGYAEASPPAPERRAAMPGMMARMGLPHQPLRILHRQRPQHHLFQKRKNRLYSPRSQLPATKLPLR